MRLSDAEFDAMNSRTRRALQRCIEWPVFKRLGLADCGGKDVVEVGCGSGYGAWLLSSLGPGSYVGFDVMPEQIAIAKRLRQTVRLSVPESLASPGVRGG